MSYMWMEAVDPVRDIETINLELIFSDIEILDRRIAKTAKGARMDKTLAKELALLENDQGTLWKKESWQKPLNLAKMRMSRSGLKNIIC